MQFHTFERLSQAVRVALDGAARTEAPYRVHPEGDSYHLSVTDRAGVAGFRISSPEGETLVEAEADLATREVASTIAPLYRPFVHAGNLAESLLFRTRLAALQAAGEAEGCVPPRAQA